MIKRIVTDSLVGVNATAIPFPYFYRARETLNIFTMRNAIVRLETKAARLIIILLNRIIESECTSLSFRPQRVPTIKYSDLFHWNTTYLKTLHRVHLLT